MSERYELGPSRGQGLVDVLDRILDKGLVIAGDIRVGLANVELLTIRIRLLICSVDKAEEIGMTWWRSDPYLSGHADQERALAAVHEKLDRLASKLEAMERKQLEK